MAVKIAPIAAPIRDKWAYVGRSLFAFWIFGICNNFSYVVMLSAAQDILSISDEANSDFSSAENGTSAFAEKCIPHLEHRSCAAASVGIVLIMNIVPNMIVKSAAPFFIDYLPFGMRHIITVITQIMSLVITAYAKSVWVALLGVAIASASSGLGEITYLALAAHYSANTISTWSSGTGMAGIIGAAAYAALTDPKLLDLTPKTSLLLMNIAPIALAITYSIVLVRAPTFKKTRVVKPKTWIDTNPFSSEADDRNDITTISDQMENIYATQTSLRQKLKIIRDLTKYMIPFGCSYFVQYFVTQGIAELVTFDCAHSLNSSPGAQYRWYQVLFQVGVFISRSSINVVQLPFWAIASMPVCQFLLASAMMLEVLSPFTPSIIVMYAIVFVVGIAGGWSYVNTMHHIHVTVAPSVKEFSLLVVSAADSVGILGAAILAIPVHNTICTLPFYRWL